MRSKCLTYGMEIVGNIHRPLRFFYYSVFFSSLLLSAVHRRDIQQKPSIHVSTYSFSCLFWLRVEKKNSPVYLLLPLTSWNVLLLNELRMNKNIRNYLPIAWKKFVVPNLHPFSTLFSLNKWNKRVNENIKSP